MFQNLVVDLFHVIGAPFVNFHRADLAFEVLAVSHYETGIAGLFSSPQAEAVAKIIVAFVTGNTILFDFKGQICLGTVDTGKTAFGFGLQQPQGGKGCTRKPHADAS